MKKYVLIMALATGMVACTSKKDSANTVDLRNVDTTGLAEFQDWKAMQENPERNTVNFTDQQTAAPAPVRTTTTRRTTSARPAPAPVASSSQGTAQRQKKGWSKAAKGAVIGGATGAAAGAIINKRNRVAGGVIGGIIGGGVGYGIGRGMDKRDGRY